MAIFIHKLGSLFEAELFLQGGIIGGRQLAGVGDPLGGKSLFLHGKTLVFTGADTTTVTFAATPANDQSPMSIGEIIDQIHTQTSNGVLAQLHKGRLALRDGTSPPTTALGLDATSTALEQLGFKGGTAVAGMFYLPSDGVPPRLISISQSSNDSNTHCLVVERV